MEHIATKSLFMSHPQKHLKKVSWFFDLHFSAEGHTARQCTLCSCGSWAHRL